MATTTVTYPYSGDDMVYDYTRHRYYITQKYVLSELGINFGTVPTNGDANPSTLGDRFIKNACNIVYRYLYRDIMNVSYQEYQLAAVPELRPVILEMLLAQIEYNATNGNLQAVSGQNIFTGQQMDATRLNDAIIAPSVKDIANTIQPCIGRALKYTGRFGGAAPSYDSADY